MSLTQQVLKSIAASATALVTVPVNSNMTSLVANVSANYAAVSATASGMQLSVQVSPDNTNRASSNVKNVTAGSGASSTATIYSAQMVIPLDEFRKDALPIESVILTLTNLDGTNAGVASLNTQTFSGANA